MAPASHDHCDVVETREYSLAGPLSAIYELFVFFCGHTEEVTLAMDEILQKEKDMKQLVQTTQFLFERTQELSARNEDQGSQLQVLLQE